MRRHVSTLMRHTASLVRRLSAHLPLCGALIAGALANNAGNVHSVEPLPQETVAHLDRLVDHTARADSPGLALLIVSPQGVQYEAHAGLSSLEHGTPIAPDSQFYLGSLSKQFTAALALTLIDDNLLQLDAPVHSIVPELPMYADDVTVRDLVHHTSGLRDYLKIRQVAGQSDEQAFDNSTVLDILGRQKALVFPAGSAYQYSNSNYVLLAEIAARVTEQPFSDLVRERVLEPAGLTATYFETDPAVPLEGRVESYAQNTADAHRRYFKLFSAIGDGGAYSTPRDMGRWAAMLLRRDTFSASFFDRYLTPDDRVPDATYAYGIHVRELRGARVLEHGGSMLGFEHWMTLFPDHDIGFVLLTNSKSFDTIALREKLSQILVGDHLAPPTPARDADHSAHTEDSGSVDLAFPELPAHVFGKYHNEEIPLDIDLATQDRRIIVTPSSFRAVSASRTGQNGLRALGGALEIRILDDKPVPQLDVRIRDLGSFTFTRRLDATPEGDESK